MLGRVAALAHLTAEPHDEIPPWYVSGVPTDGMHGRSTLTSDLQCLLDAQRDERIFVEIASSAADAIEATTANAIEQAARPDRLRFGAYVRHDDAHRSAIDARRNDPRFSFEFGSPSAPDSDQWARHRAQSFYDAEPYVLQVCGDARFVAGWDAAYTEALSTSDSDRPLLTDSPFHVRRLGGDPARPAIGREVLAGHRFTVGRFCIDVPARPRAARQRRPSPCCSRLHPRLRRRACARSVGDPRWRP